jgi:hypothetical protein
LYHPKTLKYFVFENSKSTSDVYITYAIDAVKQFEKYPSTISIHRKKETSTLYTLNSMNKLIMEENGGIFDNSFELDWKLYKNCLILTNDIGVRIIEMTLVHII